MWHGETLIRPMPVSQIIVIIPISPSNLILEVFPRDSGLKGHNKLGRAATTCNENRPNKPGQEGSG